MDAQPFLEQAVSELLQKCTNCGACRQVCPFLRRFGLPKEILEKEAEEVFYCTNCGACNFVCREKLRPKESLYYLKVKLIDRGSPFLENIVKGARAFALRGHSFPFVHWERGEVAFWPGCSLSGTAPDLVKSLIKGLKQRLGNQKLALVLDCCFDPLFQNGDLRGVEKAWRDINTRLKGFGIKRVITGCTNCYKIFKLYAQDVEISHILQEFQSEDFKEIPKDALLHFPCPAFVAREVKAYVEEALSGRVKESFKAPFCCGAGGSAHWDKDLSEAFLEKVAKRAKGRPVLTFCMGCKNRFLKKGLKAYHLLETLGESKAKEVAVSSGRKWLNRLYLSLSRKIFNKKGFLLLGFILLFGVSVYFQRKGLFSETFFKTYLEPYARHPLSFLLYLFFYALAPSLFISSLALTLTAGFLWGPFLGTVMALSGATLGATVSFLLSRYFFREAIEYKLGLEKWQYLSEKTRKHGWKAVAVARLVPFFPYPVINYLFGLTPIPLLHYVLATFIFMAPAGFAYTYLGYSLKEVFLKANFLPLLLVIAIFALLTLLVKRFLRKWKI